MILYDNKGKSLDVYEFNANEDDLTTYRKEQMKKIPEKERILVAETRVPSPFSRTRPLFESYTGKEYKSAILTSDRADDEDQKNRNIYGGYHVLKNDTRLCDRYKKKLVDSYCHGDLLDRNVIQIQYPEMMKYLLLYLQQYDYLGEYDNGRNYRMSKIIQLPESLYLLQLIEQGRFASLDGKNIDEQLTLYSLSKINEINFEELQKMDTCGITQNAYARVIDKANSDSHVLRLIKK